MLEFIIMKSTCANFVGFKIRTGSWLVKFTFYHKSVYHLFHFQVEPNTMRYIELRAVHTTNESLVHIKAPWLYLMQNYDYVIQT